MSQPIPCPSYPCAVELTTPGDFKWADPLSDDDGLRGAICVRTKVWAPASELVWTDEGPMLRILYEPPNNRNRRFRGR